MKYVIALTDKDGNTVTRSSDAVSIVVTDNKIARAAWYVWYTPERVWHLRAGTVQSIIDDVARAVPLGDPDARMVSAEDMGKVVAQLREM